MTRFTQKTLDFLARANRQKKPDWLEKNRDEYQDLVVEPTRHLIQQVARILRPQARGYHFPTRGIARLKRSGDRAKKYGALFREYVGVQVTRDSGSRFEDLPGLYFHFEPDEVFSAGGLYTPSARQIRQIRMWIDDEPKDLEKLLRDRAFQKVFPKGLGKERVLKTKPRFYPVEHPRIEWLKLTGYYVWRPIAKRDFFSARLPEILSADWLQVLRLNAVLDRYISEVPLRQTDRKERFGEGFEGIQAPQVDWSE